MSKRLLCLDFDGVVHGYASGWIAADVIPDPPVPGAIAFMREAVKHFRVAIFSSRSHQPGGLEAMRQWLGRYVLEERLSDDEDLAWASAIEWPTEKPPAHVTIDDRALTFNGTWPSIEILLAFKPWNKRGPAIELVGPESAIADAAAPLLSVADQLRSAEARQLVERAVQLLDQALSDLR